jgi:hypothetical protein
VECAHENRNPKTQDPNPKEVPSPKLQDAAATFGIWDFELLWDLGFGTWDLKT